MEIKKNNQNLKTNIYLDEFKVDTRIVPLFKTPITLKKIQLLKKFKDNKSIEVQKKLTFRIKPINQKLRKYSNNLNSYKNNIYNVILNNINIKNNNINMSKYLFLNNNDKSKLKIYLKKVLWPLHMRDNINYSSEMIQIINKFNKDKIYNLNFLKNLTKFNRNLKNLNNNSNFNLLNKILKKSRYPRIGLNKFYASLYYSKIINSSQTLPLLNYKQIKLKLSSLPNNINKDLNKIKKINLMLNAYGDENFKKIIEIRNLLLIIKNMQNHIEFLINLRKKLILKRRIKLITKILSESEDIELEKNNLNKKIQIFNKTSDNYLLFPVPKTDSFYKNELLAFKKDIELMLANSFDLFVYLKDDLSFDQIISNKFNNASDINNLTSLLINRKEDVKVPLVKDNNKLYLKYLSLPFNKSNISLTSPSVLNTTKDKKEQELNVFGDSSMNKFIKFKESIINPIYAASGGDNKVKASSDMFNYFLINKQVLEENKKKMVDTIRSMILKHKNFDSELSTVSGGLNNRAPVNIIYSTKNNKPIISHYLKSMSIFNMIKKGTFIYFSNSIGYFFKNNNLKKFKNIYKFLFYFFKTMYCLISKPVFVFKTDKIIIQLFYFVITPNFFKDKILRKNEHYNKLLNKFKQNKIKRKPFKYWINNRIRKRIWKFNKLKLKIRIALKKASNVSLIKLYPKKFNILCNVLSKAFNKNIELNLIRLHYPYKNSNIFANLLALLINKIKFRRITRKLFKFSVIKNLKNITASGDNKSNYLPAYLTGMNIKIAGRLMNYNIIPRKTVQKIQKGSSSFGKVNYTDFARYTSKNRRGAFSITVSSGQNFSNL